MKPKILKKKAPCSGYFLPLPMCRSPLLPTGKELLLSVCEWFNGLIQYSEMRILAIYLDMVYISPTSSVYGHMPLSPSSKSL